MSSSQNNMINIRVKLYWATLNHEGATGVGVAPLGEAEHHPEVRPRAVVRAVVGGEDPPRVQQSAAAPRAQRVRLGSDKDLPSVGSISNIKDM